MADRSQLAALRAEALRLTGRATRKVQRLNRVVEVKVTGTEFDIRKSKANINKLNSRQLAAYIRRVEAFNSRKTQFVPDSQARPIPISEWRGYKKAEKAHRDHVLGQFDQIKDARLPSHVRDKGGNIQPGSETVAQRRAKMRADRKLAGNPAVNDPYDPPVRDSKQFSDRGAVRELMIDERKKATKGWDDKELRRQIGEFEQMIKDIGDTETAGRVAKLSPDQFRALWNGTGFANSISHIYEIMQAKAGRDSDTKTIQDQMGDANRFLDWAASLDFQDGPAPKAEANWPKQRKHT